MSWPTYKLESLAAKEPYSFVGGPFGSKLTTRDYVESGIPVIRGANMNNGRYLGMADFVFVTESKVRNDLSSNLAKPGDIIFTQRGTLGQVAIVPSDGIADKYVVSQSQMKLTVDEAKIDRLFLYYFFSNRETTERIMSFVSSSGVPHINLTVLRNFDVPVPPLESQRNIVCVLSTYDDLIENNRRRIALLEQAAQLLYKEWFVHLRFPGHEHTKIINGVPEGWERKVLGNVCFEVREAVAPSDFEESTPYIGLEHMPRRSITLSEWGQAEQVTSSKHRFREGEILFGKIRPYFHKVGIALTDGVASSDAIIIRPVHSHFLPLVLMTTSSDRFVAVTAQQMKEGSKMPRADWKQMQQYSVPLPPDGLLSAFNDLIVPMLNQLKTLAFANKRLSTARDLLLPKLMNGEVAV